MGYGQCPTLGLSVTPALVSATHGHIIAGDGHFIVPGHIPLSTTQQ